MAILYKIFINSGNMLSGVCEELTDFPKEFVNNNHIYKTDINYYNSILLKLKQIVVEMEGYHDILKSLEQ